MSSYSVLRDLPRKIAVPTKVVHGVNRRSQPSSRPRCIVRPNIDVSLQCIWVIEGTQLPHFARCADRPYMHIGPIYTHALYVHRSYMYIGPIFTQTLYAHRPYMHTDPICTQTLYAHRPYMHTDPICTHRVRFSCRPVANGAQKWLRATSIFDNSSPHGDSIYLRSHIILDPAKINGMLINISEVLSWLYRIYVNHKERFCDTFDIARNVAKP